MEEPSAAGDVDVADVIAAGKPREDGDMRLVELVVAAVALLATVFLALPK